MNRRTAVRNFVVFSAGATLLPSCLQNDKRPSLSLKNISISYDQEQLMAALTDTILPRTDIPGASHQFALMMVDECFSKEEQAKFVQGLQQFEEIAKTRTGQSFTKASSIQRDELVKQIESKKDIPAEILSFYDTTKKLTIQSFTGSKYFLTKIRVYEMVPGRFHGCFPVA